ncbi:MAG: hypothetical protein LBH59_09195 [Planctomycetaceae bacterium]|jgi:hypothetical protein|nr:hypothetical protein [Planctomycetaceae bacterium]
MQKIVNHLFLGHLIGMLGGDVDSTFEKYKNIDSNSKEVVVHVIRQDVIPVIQSYASLVQERIRNTLQYYLATNEINFSDIFNSYLIPFDHPRLAKDFFIWIWEEWFPEESYKLSETDEYIVLNDDKKAFNDYYKVCQIKMPPGY